MKMLKKIFFFIFQTQIILDLQIKIKMKPLDTLALEIPTGYDR